MRAVLEQQRLVLVPEVVIHVAQLVVDGEQVFLDGLDAHLDAHIVGVVHVPGAGMALHFAVTRTREHGALPELLRQRRETDRGVEALRGARDLERVPFVRLEQAIGAFDAGLGIGLQQVVVDAVPLLRPHVAQQVNRDGLAVGDLVLAVFLAEPLAGVAVQALVQRLHLRIQPRGFLLEIRRRHVVTRAPQHTDVVVSEFARAFIGECGKALVLGAHRLCNGMPACPRLGQRVVIAAGGDDVAELIEVLAFPAALRRRRAIFALAVHRF